jgi:hypothetical protein
MRSLMPVMIRIAAGQAPALWAVRVSSGLSEPITGLFAEFPRIIQACLHPGLDLLEDAQWFRKGVLLVYLQLEPYLLHLLQLVLNHVLSPG